MRNVVVGPWMITVDAETTRAIHARLSSGEAEPCSCPECSNFFAAAERIYPASAKSVFRALGAEPPFITDLSHLGRNPDGTFGCVGWFHVVGTVAGPTSDGDAAHAGFALTPTFQVWARADDVLAPAAFRGHPLVQIEFLVAVPWVLPDTPAPDSTDGEGSTSSAPDRR